MTEKTYGCTVSQWIYFHGSIPNFNDYFLAIIAFSSECDNLRLAKRLKFGQTFLSLKQFKISSKDAIQKVVMFPVFACMLQWFYHGKYSAIRDLFQYRSLWIYCRRGSWAVAGVPECNVQNFWSWNHIWVKYEFGNLYVLWNIYELGICWIRNIISNEKDHLNSFFH